MIDHDTTDSASGTSQQCPAGTDNLVRKQAIVIGAGPCGLVAIKEMLEAGHEVAAFDKGPGLGGAFCRTFDTQYENLYLTISNHFMAFSDFPAQDSRIKYSSKAEYGDYLAAYAEHFNLTPHISLNTSVDSARLVDGRWQVTTSTKGDRSPVQHEADVLIVATGANHRPNRIAVEGFDGEIIHSSEYVRTDDFAGRRVLLIGVGESGSDISADISRVAKETIIWARTPIAVAPRFPGILAQDPGHDELKVIKDEGKWGNTRIFDFLEVLTTSRMANAAPMWAYATIRRAIWGVCKKASPAAQLLSTWYRQVIKDDPWLGDQVSVPTKNARICTEAANGNLKVVIAPSAKFSGRDASFSEASYQGNAPCLMEAPREVCVKDIDTIILCTGYTPDFSWLAVDGLDTDPRTWFKHCFPAGIGDKLMFLGWARPHQGGIPACADLLSRYAAAIASGELSLPPDYAERARTEAAAESAFYKYAQNVRTLVDYPAFMDSVAKLAGCLPRSPGLFRPSKLLKYWTYPNWPVWYRQRGRGATPKILDQVLDALPLKGAFRPDPFILMAFLFSIVQLPINLLLPRRTGLTRGWRFRSKKYLLHGNR